MLSLGQNPPRVSTPEATRGERALLGLREEEVAHSRRRMGENRLTRQRGRGFWSHFFANLNDPVIRILLVALLLNFVLAFRGGDRMETVGIGVSVLLATLISTLSECRSQRAFERLQATSMGKTCRVMRAEGIKELPWEAVVVGDLIALGAGDGIPADGVLLRGELRVDQSAMTGESREIKKHPDSGELEPGAAQPSSPSALFRGSAVTGGEGVMRVMQVGDRTALGGISREVQSEGRDSPLRLRLARLAKQISIVGYIAAALVAAAYLFHAFFADSGFSYQIMRMKLTDLPYLATTLLHALTLGLTVIVVAVPEGLPMMIAVVLSANTRRMVRDRVLVRKGAGIEAAGSMNLLFTDKTGTLTQGKLGVGEVWMQQGVLAPSELSEASPLRQLLQLSLVINNGANYGENGTPLGGNATDRALLSAARQLHLTDTGGEREAVVRLAQCPFDSSRKFAACAVRLPDGREMTLIKGAPDRLLPRLTQAVDGMGKICPLDLPRVRGYIAQKSGAGDRMLALAFMPRALTLREMEAGRFDGACFLCAVQLLDQLRPGATHAVQKLQGAGVQVVMITGDAPETAASIAQSCGILCPTQGDVLTGEQIAAMSDEQLRAVLPHLAVVARARPCDKSRLVRVAQQENRVVGMTGDGVNDAPALRLADIGFAMGSGSEVAKDAGDIVILDNDLSSIVNAVLYGRNIFKSIRKFITLQLTMNFCAVGVSMIGPFIGVDAPVTVVQMLWINLIMDTLGGLAFAGEAPLPSCLEEPPKKRDTPILCRYMVNQIVWLGTYTIALCLFFLKSPWVRAQFRGGNGELCHLTAFFALFIFASVFHCFSTRSDRRNLAAGLMKNRAFLGIMLLILVVQILFVYLGGSVLRTVPLTAGELGLTALMALTVLPADQIRKQIWHLRGRRDRF
jgi:calcium-translocating P-type ATPase